MRLGDGFTLDDWLALPDDGLRYELVDGSLHVTPPPVPRHQLLVNRLLDLVRLRLPESLTCDYTGSGISELGKDSARALVPDLLIAARDLGGAAAPTLRPADVRLVAEVVSPASWRVDHNDKREIYAAWGVPHYWIVDQRPEPRVTVLRLDGDRYAEEATGGEGDVVYVSQPLDVHIDVAELFAE